MSYEDKSGKETKKRTRKNRQNERPAGNAGLSLQKKGGSRCTTQIMKKMIDAMII